jgi:hypothetical protein
MVSSNLAEIIEEEFYPQNNGEISDSITQNWTEQALECYKLNCNCSLCSVSKGNYSFICQMPKILEALIKSTGTPLQKAKLSVVSSEELEVRS